MPIALREVEFDKDGHLFDRQQLLDVVADLGTCTDLLVLSHGWNNNKEEARELYAELLGRAGELVDAGKVPAVAGRKFHAIGILWPSKKFEDSELIPSGGAASAGEASDGATQRLLVELKVVPNRLGERQVNEAHAAVVANLAALLGSLDNSAQARKEFVLHLRALMDPSATHSEDGSTEFFTEDPQKLFERLGDPVIAPLAAGVGGATSIGGAAGLHDLVIGARAAARRMLNFVTYYQMKSRAGLVGTQGLAPALREIRAAKNVALHLVGHSFGGRLVTAAADSLPDGTPRVTVSLLQAAFSHNGLAPKFDGDHDGAFRGVLAKRRVSGPVIITHTKNDRAVGIAYPLASRIAHQQAAALGDQNDPYGGMGRNGAQHTPEVRAASRLGPVGTTYTFRVGEVFNLQADEFIKGHGEVHGKEVAYAILSAAGAA